MKIYVDTETRCRLSLDDVGLHRYAEEAEIVLIQYAIDNGPVNVLVWAALSDEQRVNLHGWFSLEGVTLVAHNAEFDRVILARAGMSGYKWECTMAQANYNSLPASLETLAKVLGATKEYTKDQDGEAAMRFFASPTRSGVWATKKSHPVLWEQYLRYASQDVMATRFVHGRMPPLPPREKDIYALDQKINDRGMCIDVDFATKAEALSVESQKAVNDAMSIATGGLVTAATQVKGIMQYCFDTGHPLLDLTKDTVERAIASGHPATPVLQLRQMGSKTSNAKYSRLIGAVSKDGRLRGSKMYCGASRTGRWSGRVFQPDNLPRLTKGETPEGIEAIIEAVKVGSLDLLMPPLDYQNALSNAIRGVVIAPTGKKLIIADYANIEGRVVAWLAGEEWKLQAYRDYDAGTSPDTYKDAYSRVFGVPVDQVTKDQRQIGKVMELMLGYQGGVGAFINGAAVYGIDLESMAKTVWPLVPHKVADATAKAYEWAVDTDCTFGLSQKTYRACDAIKRMWRWKHPRISALWRNREDAIKAQIPQGGTADAFVNLPSGRVITYHSARVEAGKVMCKCVDPTTKQWVERLLYGGMFVENETQAIASDVLREGLLAADDDGLDIVLHVHDEGGAEVDEDVPLDRLIKAMTKGAPWMAGLPLAAAGFEAKRYRKE